MFLREIGTRYPTDAKMRECSTGVGQLSALGWEIVKRESGYPEFTRLRDYNM
jgi:hypothetical protein